MRIRWLARRSEIAAMPLGGERLSSSRTAGAQMPASRPDRRLHGCRAADQLLPVLVLVALAPELSGKGLGRRIWCAVLAMHHHEGVEEVATSISSHNSIVHNLYVSLGFRFPLPEIILHWCPAGPLRSGTA